ncbi:hypothetical protein N7481_012055 [Penicillium waksmanii]|uniref:uncharacterized protein n=1 Tax=Penicillium waksmanii TaxID=69791 RepID=UPI0025499980|nr:uncharacterized protein N7481_012055 [Penicillium waksmanii]KAJ5965341.1 hypothetical protein N7481_012055 [Penicillium waksmanii]
MRFTGLVALSLAGLATAVPVYVNPNSPMSKPAENGHNGPAYRILDFQSAGSGSLTTPTPTPILPTTTGTPRATPSVAATGQPDNLSQKTTKFHEDFEHWVNLPNGAEKEREKMGKEIAQGPEKSCKSRRANIHIHLANCSPRRPTPETHAFFQCHAFLQCHTFSHIICRVLCSRMKLPEKL